MADLGYVALLLAFALGLYSATAALVGARRDRPELVASARNGLLAIAALLTFAAVTLWYLLLTPDFQVKYVAGFSSRDMPFNYLIAAFWAGNEGSLLWLAWVLSLLGAVALLVHWRRDRALMPYVIATIAAVELFFVSMMVFQANPFHVLPFVPPDGRGINPLLETRWMVVHPPALMTGFVAWTIPFAFAMAALASGRLGNEWIDSVRQWAIVAWLVLGLGNLAGSAWAYGVLGWGGYWGWDPVENAALMPWLVGTAFIHSIIIQKRRGMLKVWNMVLIILTFGLAMFGTFLDRSGVISSVHSFAADAFAPLYLTFILGSAGVAAALVVYRLPLLRSDNTLDAVLSREAAFLLNNLLFLAVAFATFWGTLFPIVSEAVRGVKVTVAAPFFSQVNGPLMLALVILMGIAPLISWRKATPSYLARNLAYPLGAALAGMGALLLVGVRQGVAVMAVGACILTAGVIFQEWARGSALRHRTFQEGWATAFGRLIASNRPRYGGYVAHLGIVLVALGVVGSSFYQISSETTIPKGGEIHVGAYRLRYDAAQEQLRGHKLVTAATLTVFDGNPGRPIDTLVAERSVDFRWGQAVSEVALRSAPLEDLYVVLAGVDGSGAATFKVFVNPLVLWIWVGGLVLLLGGVVSLWPGREKGSSP
ncbi:MAG: heme lyase CcmF/NrfE family subunit [Chloroflexi bacterium]|nr:heme lyase CcmF/NrfE family subunit [Chloroflexota bacterium]